MIQFWSGGVPEGPSMGYGHFNVKVIRHFGWSAILLLVFLFTDTHSQNVRFQWVTGPWGPCQHSRCGYGGLQYRDVRCQMPSGQPVLPGNCESSLRPTDAQECIKPCTDSETSSRGDETYRTPSPSTGGEDSRQGEVILNQPRDRVSLDDGSVEWVVSQWSSCRLAPGVATCGRNNGVRYRNVTCERKDRRVLMDEYLCARVERKPASSEPCELLCRQDCVVTPYADWSSCDITCHITNRTRTRRIVVPPRHRGDHCPPFSEMLPCENCTETFTYNLGEWGPCTLIGNTYRPDVKVHPILGHRSREINCLTSKGTLTALRNCAEKIPDVLLVHHQTCIIPQDCQVSTWSALRPYNSSCLAPDGSVISGFMIRTRMVLQLPMGDGLACPPNLVDLVQVHGEDPTTLKPCKRAKWILSSWSVCASVPGYSHCGTGIQSRRAICVAPGDDGVERPVDEVECPQPKPLMSQSCQTDCNWDCSVSQWSDWSRCQNGACSAENYDYILKRKKRAEGQAGKRFRTREILTLPGPGGKGCLHLSETQTCEPEPCFRWRVTYGDCEPTTRGGCGQGTRQRFAECVDREGVKMKTRFCWEHQADNRPWEECNVPCPDDCVLAEWGSWSQCPDPCSPVSQGPAIKVRTRRILAHGGTGSKAIPCPSPPSLRETAPCPAPLECTVYTWKVSGWDRCTVSDPAHKCGPGTQRREVNCYNSMGLRVVEQRCEESVRPNSVQNCLVECPVDCHVTEWSEWSDCGTNCLAFTARQLLPKQRRQRFIVTYPQDGGLPCPHTLSEERQCLNLPVCETYYWDISDWSGCILPPIVPLCGDGLRARNVTCRHSNGSEYGLDVCLEKLSNMPELVEHCYAHCSSDCQLSEWSPWARCVQGCEGKRFRWRKLIGESKVIPECRNQNRYPLDEQEDCVCDSLIPVVIGDWSDCILQPPEEVGEKFAQMSLKSLQLRTTNESRDQDAPNQAYCGKGIKYKAISCQTSRRDMEGPASCSATEYQEAECIIPCPVDCQMSPWSAWSVCSVTCGSGIQQRFRSIQRQPENGGRRCPQLYGYSKESQTRVCKAGCQYHKWQADDWGPCLPHGGSACGPGTQARTVGCYAVVDGSQMLSAADTSYCNSKDRPPNVRDCDLPCPGECVMSDWTVWTPCRQPCNGQQTQTRTRSVLRYAGQFAIGSEDCAPSQDVKVCIKGDNCFEYSWELSDWTTCLINDGSEGCGVGHKERFAMCRNEAGQRVDDVKCMELFGGMTEPLVVSCEIPCDNDCLLSDWSDWSICSQTCGLGVTIRYRTIVQAPVGNGRKCPDHVDQSRPCFRQGCYHWQVTEWSVCRTQNGVCGSGLQERNVSCVGQDGLAVNSSRCPHDTEKLVLKTRRLCHVPCPGECRLSEWSHWSQCFISCQDFEQGFRSGVRARSRAILANPSPGNPPCDDNLWEEETCSTDSCLGFLWVAGQWGSRPGSTRSVRCERTDGLVVEGGCSQDTRPEEVLSCDPPCLATNSYCRDSNFCDCLGLSVAVRNNGTFLGCDMNLNRNSTTPITTATVEPASTTSIWMYAVIAVGTIFVISVAAALYNMCELFRTGPRPRGKGAAANKTGGNDDTRSGTQTPVAMTDTTNAKNAEIEELYKQCHLPAQRPDYQNVEEPDFPPPPPPIAPKSELDVRIPGNHVHHAGGRGDVESGRKHVGRSSMRMACSPEESEQLFPLASLPAPQHACASSPSSVLSRAQNRRYPAWSEQGHSPRGRLRRMRGVFGACLRRGSDRLDEDGIFREEDGGVDDVIDPRIPCMTYVEGGRRPDGGWGAGHNVSSLTTHPNCMLRETELCSPRKATKDKARDKDKRGSKTPDSNKRSPSTPTNQLSFTSNSSKYISLSPSTSKDSAQEELELGNVNTRLLPSGDGASDFREDVRNRGSLSNISELSFDRPISESSLKLGLTAESLQAAIAQIESAGEAGNPNSSMASEDTGFGLSTSATKERVQDVLSPSSASPVEDLPDFGSSPRDVLYTDPRILRLSRQSKDGSLDSGHSTLPPSRNGSMENPVEPSSWASLSLKRQLQLQQQQHHQDPTAAAGAVSPTARDGNLAFRQSLDNARAARKNVCSNLPPFGTGSLPYSPSVSRPSSVASSSPSSRRHRIGMKQPSGASSPGSRSLCDSCQKVIGPGEYYTSDTQDSLSEMSDRSGMETTV